MRSVSNTNANSPKLTTSINTIINDIIRQLELNSEKSQRLMTSISFLSQIQQFRKKKWEDIYDFTLAEIIKLSILQPYEIQYLFSLLLPRYFKKMDLFRDVFEKGVPLTQNSADQSEQPIVLSLSISIGVPYSCPPLKDAVFLGEAKCYTLDQEDQSIQAEKFS